MARFLNWTGYQLVMWLPYWISCNAKTRFGGWCLERAGAHAYPPSPPDHVIKPPARKEMT